jgi:hypothetical protein
MPRKTICNATVQAHAAGMPREQRSQVAEVDRRRIWPRQRSASSVVAGFTTWRA